MEGLDGKAQSGGFMKEFLEVQKEYYNSLVVEMREDCETYRKATECHEYAKLMIEKLGKVREGFEQYQKNCYEYSAGASCHNAGNMLLIGGIRDATGNVAIDRDVPAAAEFYKQACNTTYARSCVPIAKLLQYGKYNIAKDYKKAFEYLSTGCQKNNTESCFAKANCYIQGMGVEQDYSKAIPLLEDACSKGHHQSCHNLGALFFHGDGVTKDLDKFKFYNDKAQIFRGQKDPFLGKPPTEKDQASRPMEL